MVFLLRRGIGDWAAVWRVVIVFAVFGTLWSVPWVRPDAPEFTGFFGEVGWGWVSLFEGTPRWWIWWALVGVSLVALVIARRPNKRIEQNARR